MKDITVIIPIHTIDNDEINLIKTALSSVKDQKTKPEELLLVCTKELEKELNKLDFGDINKRILVNDSEYHDFASQINFAVDSCNTEYFCILELDDELSSIWIEQVKVYMKENEDVDVFLPLITNVDTSNKFIGWSNEPVWAMGFTEEIGFLDLDALLQYPNFNIDGMVMNCEFFQNHCLPPCQ